MKSRAADAGEGRVVLQRALVQLLGLLNSDGHGPGFADLRNVVGQSNIKPTLHELHLRVQQCRLGFLEMLRLDKGIGVGSDLRAERGGVGRLKVGGRFKHFGYNFLHGVRLVGGDDVKLDIVDPLQRTLSDAGIARRGHLKDVSLGAFVLRGREVPGLGIQTQGNQIGKQHKLAGHSLGLPFAFNGLNMRIGETVGFIEIRIAFGSKDNKLIFDRLNVVLGETVDFADRFVH